MTTDSDDLPVTSASGLAQTKRNLEFDEYVEGDFRVQPFGSITAGSLAAGGVRIFGDSSMERLVADSEESAEEASGDPEQERLPTEDEVDNADEVQAMFESVNQIVAAKHVASWRQSRIKYEELEEAFGTIKEGLKTVEEVEDLRARVARAVARANEAKEMGQFDLHEELLSTAAGWVLEQQAAAAGAGRWIERAMVHEVVRLTASKHRLMMTELSRFPRVIPDDIRLKIKAFKPIFSDFTILFTDPKGVVKNKDPILFGTIRCFPERLYFVADWVDEYCDLTIDKFLAIGEATLQDGWKVQAVPPQPTDADLKALVDRLHGVRKKRPLSLGKRLVNALMFWRKS